MTLNEIPESRKRSCNHCQCIVDGNGAGTHRLVTAYIPCQRNKGKDSHTFYIVNELDRYVCSECYDRMKRGIHPAQGNLFTNDGTA